MHCRGEGSADRRAQCPALCSSMERVTICGSLTPSSHMKPAVPPASCTHTSPRRLCCPSPLSSGSRRPSRRTNAPTTGRCVGVPLPLSPARVRTPSSPPRASVSTRSGRVVLPVDRRRPRQCTPHHAVQKRRAVLEPLSCVPSFPVPRLSPCRSWIWRLRNSTSHAPLRRPSPSDYS